MKAERNVPRTHFEAHFSCGWRRSGLSQRNGVVIQKAPCLHLSQKRYFDCQKTKGAGFKPPREAARSYYSRDFFEIWERESAPADYCLI